MSILLNLFYVCHLLCIINLFHACWLLSFPFIFLLFQCVKPSSPSVLNCHWWCQLYSCQNAWLKINYWLVKSSGSCACLYLAARICRLMTLGFLQHISNLDIVLLHYELLHSGKIWSAIYFMTVQIFAFGKLNICPQLWCNHWLSCHNGRQNCYVLTRFKVNNCIHARLLCFWRNLDAHWRPTPQLRTGDGQYRRPIQWHVSAVVLPVHACRKPCLPYDVILSSG